MALAPGNGRFFWREVLAGSVAVHWLFNAAVSSALTARCRMATALLSLTIPVAMSLATDKNQVLRLALISDAGGPAAAATRIYCNVDSEGGGSTLTNSFGPDPAALSRVIQSWQASELLAIGDLPSDVGGGTVQAMLIGQYCNQFICPCPSPRYLQAALASAQADGLEFAPRRLLGCGEEALLTDLSLDASQSDKLLVLNNNNSADLVSSCSPANAAGGVSMLGFKGAARGLPCGIEDPPDGRTDSDFNDLTVASASARMAIR